MAGEFAAVVEADGFTDIRGQSPELAVSAAVLPLSLAEITKRLLRSLSMSTGRVRLQIIRSPS
jgi:hypothetical protein